MQSVKEVIVVEGRYDKNTLSQVVDAVILETSGFSIFNDSQKRRLLRRLAESRGLIVLTDSDGAGFVIRSHISSFIPPEHIKHAFVPEIAGKEKRKSRASAEGKLGVEGMRPEVLLEALRRAGATFEGEEKRDSRDRVTKADLYRLGLYGREMSAKLRSELLASLDLPRRISTDMLIDVINASMSPEEFFSLVSPRE